MRIMRHSHCELNGVSCSVCQETVVTNVLSIALLTVRLV